MWHLATGVGERRRWFSLAIYDFEFCHFCIDPILSMANLKGHAILAYVFFSIGESNPEARSMTIDR